MKKKKRIVEIDTIHGINTLFLAKAKKDSQSHEYLGPDGIKVSDTHKIYLKKCEEFRAKAKKYFDDNVRLKKSMIHKDVVGYKYSEELEREIAEESFQNTEKYFKSTNQFIFSEVPDEMYENFKAKTKRIRLIQDLEKPRVLDFSEHMNKGNQAWFARYQALSRFVQAARLVILKIRLEKNLSILRKLTIEDLEAFEKENENEEDELCEPGEIKDVGYE